MATDGKQSVRASVEIDGQPLPAECEPVLEQVVVDQHLHLADSFLLCFRDLDRTILDKAKVRIASKIRISGTELGGTKPVLLFAGDVTTIEGDYHPRGNRTIVRGYDASHRMNVGRWTATWQDAKDSEIVKQIGETWGLEAGTIEDGGPVHRHLSQVNVSDWDFLRGRARALGFEVTVTDGKLNFRKPVPASDAPSGGEYTSTNPLQMVFGDDLLEFRPRITAAGQVTGVSVRSWDFRKKEPIQSVVKAETTSVALPDNGRAFAQKFHSPQMFVVDQPYGTQAEVDAAAASTADAIASTWAEADGVARGNPRLRAGSAVAVSVVASSFAGRYTLTRARHVFDQDGYRTEFVVSGRQERSLLGLTSQAFGNGTGAGQPFYGLVVAIVTDNNDPDKLARVKLKFPWLADDYQSDWARIATLGAGPNSGAVWIPEVNDEVLVGFLHGDINHPYVVGGLYNGKDKPNLGDGLFDHGKVKRRGFVSRRGHKMLFMDAPGKSGIALITSNGQLKLTLDESRNEIRITAGNLQVKAEKIQIKADGTIAIEAGGTLTLKGSTVNLN
jgi:phage protein D/phage baseplate assembly protein gpV